MEIRFVIPGAPVPKARARTVCGRSGRPHSFTPQRTRDYERAVGVLARAAGCRPTAAPVRVAVEVYLPDARRRDLDNMVKSVTDGMNGIAYADDSQIVEIRAVKSIDRTHPRAVVSVEEVAR